MKVSQILKGALIGGVVMLIMGVAVQLLPWGFNAVGSLPAEAAVERMPGALYLVEGSGEVGRPAAFVAYSDPAWHSIPRKLAYDLGMQVAIAGVFAVILLLTVSLRNRERVGIIFGMAVAASIGCFLPDWNWWGFSLRYALGASVNLLLVWTAVGYVLARWVLPPTHRQEEAGSRERFRQHPAEPAGAL